jgi:hypothetical protein
MRMTLSEWTKTPPAHACWVIFRGLRTFGRGRVIEMNEPVRIEYVWRGRVKELAVAAVGRQQKIRLTNFDGEWQIIDLEERCDGPTQL